MIDPLLEAGEMPVLNRLIEEGVMGNLATLQPAISPMLWTSIATGKTADKHGILGFTQRDADTGTPRPFPSVARKTKAIWNILQQALGWRCHVANWWASHPAEPLDGVTVSNFFFTTRQVGPNIWRVPQAAIHPQGLEAEFGPLRMGINEIDQEMVLPFIPRAAEIDQKLDNRLEQLAGVLSDCISEQAVATAVLEHEPWQFAAVYSDAIDHFSHAFMKYHPPRQPNIPEQDFEIYKDVMRGVYRFHDMMLGRLIELAGPEATIVLCSDHGFQSGMLRPLDNPREPAGPTFWHRDFGILVMKGPGIKRDERIYGANLLDIVPTLLTLVGLPVARDMDGKPLLEALENPNPIAPIASWDDVPGRDGQHPPGTKWDISVEEADAIIQQFAALGYVDEPTDDRLRDGETTELETQYNLAQVHLSAARPEKAVKILEELLARQPWESRYIHQLANAYIKGGWFRAAEDLLERAYPNENGKPSPAPHIVWQMRAKAALRLGDRERAADLLEHVMQHMLLHPSTWVEAGWLWVELRRLPDAEKCFHRALELDPDSAAAYQGLSTIHLRRKENGLAIDAALEAVQRLHHLPMSHLNLGIALAREGELDAALVAFRRTLGMQPDSIRAHRWLAALHGSKRPDDFLAHAHRNQSIRLSRERMANAPAQSSRNGERRAAPDLPSFAERRRLEAEARPRPDAPVTSGRTFLLVSGLPRSGTSLMMQMLAAGGMPPRTDGLRTADGDNPEGYFEWEAIKRISKEPQLLDEPELENKAIKVISALLTALPRVHNYRVIFMRRPVAEIAASQSKMIAHRGTAGLEKAEDQIASALSNHAASTLQFLRSKPTTFEVLEVDYPELVTHPEAWIGRIVQFVGVEKLPHPERLSRVVRKDLHRNRAAENAGSAGE